MDLIKFENLEGLYPNGVEGLFRSAYKSMIDGEFWKFEQDVLKGKVFYPVFRGMVYDKKWANFSYLLGIIYTILQKENYGFKRNAIDNHKIIICKPNLITEYLPCTLCSHLNGHALNFQQFVCEMPLSKIDCCNKYGRCMGYYQLMDSNNEILKDKRISLENGVLKFKIKV